MTSIFLAYARADDEAFVRRLYADLTAADFTVWLDRESLMSRGLTFHQEIKDAIRTEVDRVMYVGGPKAAHSAYVREEWQFALECDHVVVIPILRLGDYDQIPGELGLLHCEDFRDDAQYPAALAKLVTSLRQPNPTFGALFAVPTLPPHFLARPELMRRVRDALLVDLQKPQVITSADAHVGMQGMGGIGKSVLAAALARNRKVRQSYPDGIVWISCGQNLSDGDRLKRLRDLVWHLGGDNTFQSLPQGQGVLRELLQARAVLLVLDDVWHAADAQIFDFLGPRCRMLVTTRDAGILHTLHGELVPVSLFTEPEALQLLADAVGVEPSALPTEARDVAHECGLLPLALALCGGMAKNRGGDFHSVLERLRRADLEKIADRESINEAHRSIWRAMQASVDMLSDDEQRRFAELSVFATDQAVPEAAAATLWLHTGDLNDLDTEELLINLAERSLIQLDPRTNAEGKDGHPFTLHDLLRDYAVRIAGKPQALHQTLLDAYQKKCLDGWPSGPDDHYFFENLCEHLISSGKTDDAVLLLTGLPWIEAKCDSKLVFSLQDDYRDTIAVLPEAQESLRQEREQQARLARWTAEITEYSREWSERGGQLARGEVVSEPEPRLPEPPASCQMWTEEEIHAECRRITENPTRLDRMQAFAGFVEQECYPLQEFGTRPGFVVQHAFNNAPRGPVHGAAAQALSAVEAPLLTRHWFARDQYNPRPALLRTLEGHTKWVNSVSVAPDGRRAVSGSMDKTLRFWDLETGACLQVLEGHTWEVRSVSVTPDSRRAVSAGDTTIRVWDLETGACLRMLEGHNVRSVSVMPDGQRAVSASPDKTLRVWDLETGVCLRMLEGQSISGTSLSVTADGRRAVSASLDKTLPLWNLETGVCLRAPEEHTDSVNSVSVAPDGRFAVSASNDETLRVWDLAAGACLRVLEGHTAGVLSVKVTPDGRRAVSASQGAVLQVWDLETGVCLQVLAGHTDAGLSVEVTPDGRRAVSASWDKTLRLWDLETGACLYVLEGHTSSVISVSITPDNRFAVSGGADSTLRVWDLDTGVCLHVLEGHSNPVKSVSITPDDRFAVSGGADSTLRVWDLDTGVCLHVLEGHSNTVNSVSVTPDGQLAVSASNDETLRVWDLETTNCRCVLQGHKYRVRSVSITPDSRLVVSASDDHTVRVWNLKTGLCLAVTRSSQGISSVALRPAPVRIIVGTSSGEVLQFELRGMTLTAASQVT